MAKKKSEHKSTKTTAHADGSRAIDIGIAAGDRRRIAEGLGHVLADAYTLYLKTSAGPCSTACT